MRSTGLLLGFFALSLFLLPALTAQEKKADKKDVADEKKETKDEKKDPDKPEKKEAAVKEKKPPEEKLQHGAVVKAKIISMKPDSAHDFTIEWPMPDPQKIMNLQMWQTQQMISIMQDRNPVNRTQRMYQFQMQLAQKQANETYTMKPVDVRATDDCKVRIMYPPVQYDDSGNLKKWTKKELDKLRAGSKLPGYPADFDLLKTGQFVELYLAKPHPSLPSKEKNPKVAAKKKKDEDAPDPMEIARPEVVMIVIWAEPMGR